MGKVCCYIFNPLLVCFSSGIHNFDINHRKDHKIMCFRYLHSIWNQNSENATSTPELSSEYTTEPGILIRKIICAKLLTLKIVIICHFYDKLL